MTVPEVRGMFCVALYPHSPEPHGDAPELHNNDRVPQAHDVQDHLQVGGQATNTMQEQHRRVSTAQALTESTLQWVGSTPQHEAGAHAQASCKGRRTLGCQR